MTKVANGKVKIAVVVDVSPVTSHTVTVIVGLGCLHAKYTTRDRDLFERTVALVAIESVRSQSIGSNEDVGPPIVIDVRNACAPRIVERAALSHGDLRGRCHIDERTIVVAPEFVLEVDFLAVLFRTAIRDEQVQVAIMIEV